MENFTISPIGYIKNDFKFKFGIPRQSGRAKSLLSRIVFNEEFRNEEAFRCIEEFSHLWIIFDFSKAHTEKYSLLVRPPRLGGNKKVGVFASRSPFRPNNIGLSSVKLERIEKTKEYGLTLIVSGADLLDGTPIYDIKPYLTFTDCHIDAVCGYADKEKDYKLQVIIPDNLKDIIPSDKLTPLIECLEDDPRPSYQDDGKEYGLTFADINIKFTVKDKILTVSAVEKI